MDMDGENDDSDVGLVNKVKPGKKLVELVTGNAQERDINDKISSILKTQRDMHVHG